ncbi:MAG: chemotaxis-specific protein-glutamate methyltransferase CheB [Phycisphaerae bacterium]
MAQSNIRLLIIEDSTFVRTILRSALAGRRGIEVIGFASGCEEVIEKIDHLQPDVVTVDVDMADRQGLEVLNLVQSRCSAKIVVIASLNVESAGMAMEALERGAFDFAVKPRKSGVDGIPRFRELLCEKIIAAVRAAKSRTSRGPLVEVSEELSASRIEGEWVVGIGTGTGGPQTLTKMLPFFPPSFPAILIAQHMPPYFSNVLAERLAATCRMVVHEAVDAQVVKPGEILIAPGGLHLQVARRGAQLVTVLEGGPRVSGHRPAADLLFESIANACGARAVGVLLTGAGRDGVSGLAKLRKAGAWTVVQDRATSYVFGMAGAAIRAGVVDQVLPLRKIPGAIAALMSQGCRETVMVP